MQTEKLNPHATTGAFVAKGGGQTERAEAHGTYSVQCFDKDGNLKWEDEIDNVVTTVGKNVALDAFLAGSSYTVAGPYMGLINSTASSAVVGDTMASHTGWLEVGNANAPTYTSPRKTVAWSAAASGSKSTSTTVQFSMTGSGTVGGCFIVFGTGAVSTIDSTAGTLYSAGAFTGGSKTVVNGDVIAVSYTASL